MSIRLFMARRFPGGGATGGDDADDALLGQEPLRARALLATITMACAVALLWAAFARIDEVTRGDGRVIPSQHLQVVQSLDGGVVSEILVRDGDIVEADQTLLRIDQTRFESSVRENRVQYYALVAKAARLKASMDGAAFVVPEEIEREDPRTVGEERRFHEFRLGLLATTTSIARQQLLQRRQELTEMYAKYEQADKSLQIATKELSVTRPLIVSGAVSEVELLRLEREVARYRGERGVASAQISRLQSAISEAAHKLEEVGIAFRNESSRDFAETMAKLNAMAESNIGLSDKVSRSTLRSPVKGTVKRLLINTVGGVVQPGKDVVEIVPLDDSLLVEARVQPRDIAFLRPDQKVVVKFTAYDFSTYGGLEGRLVHIGADSMIDEKGNAYYVVRARTDKSSLGANLPVIPGMVAEVDIVTGDRSVLNYLLKPILRAKARILSER